MTSIKYSNSFGKKNLCKNGIHGLLSTSKTWQEASEHRRIVNLDDNSVTREKNLVIVDMSSWTGKPSAADWTNYVRVYEHVDATEVGTEINSQPIDSSWAGGNHDSVAFLCSDTSTKTYFSIYYGETSLGVPSYTSGLTVTADSPAANDYTIQQDDYYQIELDYSNGGLAESIITRVSGGNVDIGAAGNSKGMRLGINKNGTYYYVQYEQTPTITQVEGTTGANAGAVLVVFTITGVFEDAAHNPLQDDSAANITYKYIWIFCDCQLIKVISQIIIANNVSNIQDIETGLAQVTNGYFSHQSYKYSSTHTVETFQTRDISSNWSNKKYAGFFDITSNDGIMFHYESETSQNIETPFWKFFDAAPDFINWYPDKSGSNTTYSAGIEELITWIQIDDFTEADGNNDDDGDQPAHRKNDELLTSLDQNNYNEVSF